MHLVSVQNEQKHRISYTDFLAKVEQGEIDSVVIRGQRIEQVVGDRGRGLHAYAPKDAKVTEALQQKHVAIRSDPDDPPSSTLVFLVSSIVPVGVIVVLWLLFMRQMQ